MRRFLSRLWLVDAILGLLVAVITFYAGAWACFQLLALVETFK